jgi:hypothetical protein
MGDGQHGQDSRTYGDLYADLLLADWDIDSTARAAGGLTVTFRRRDDRETWAIAAQDIADAIRKLLADVETEGER